MVNQAYLIQGLSVMKLFTDLENWPFDENKIILSENCLLFNVPIT